MCCFFNCNPNCNRQNRPVRPIPIPVIGPQGPRGPQGPQGIPGTNDIVYAGVNTATPVATATIIPIGQINSTPNSTMTVSNNAVNLPSAGTYLISYSVNGAVPTGNLATSLYLNGAPIPNETITMTNTANALSSGSKTVLITTTGPATLSLFNTSTDTATYNSAVLSVLRTA